MNSEGRRNKQKVGRPKLPKEQRRARITPIKFSAEEHAFYQKKADKEGLKLSDWIREKLKSAAKE
jgi:hypothetical protein